MGVRTMAVTLFAVVAGALPGHGAAGAAAQDATLYPRPKPPYSELFTVQPPAPKTGARPEQPPRVEVHPLIQTEVRIHTRTSPTARIVCGMKIFEGDADVDPGIVKPIPEGHHAKIRVLGPAPCERADAVAPDRR